MPNLVPITTLAAVHDFPLLTTIAAGFAAAWVLGLVTQRIGLSPIVGYLLAGVIISPNTPGFAGDIKIAQQLAELGVILLMFGVGLHFHLKDLLAVKGIAVPGAVGQSLVATVLAMAVFFYFGWPLRAGMVRGMAMAVASTVVLLRVLMDKDMLNSSHGHAAVGWLIVEDIFTVLALVLVPMLALDQPGAADVAQPLAEAASAATGEMPATDSSATSVPVAIAWAVAKLVALVAIVLLAGSRIVPWILNQVAKLRSQELFTLTVLVLSIAIAVGSAVLFDASVALGAFLAGMVVAQSPVSHQAAADALPMRDAFAVLFFVSVGMLFNPMFIFEQPMLVAAGLAIVLVAKPLAALLIVAILGYPARTALTVAIGLAQIGEFSFILGQVASHHKLLPGEGFDVLVATAMVSITLNPLLFRQLDAVERFLQRRPRLWRLLNGRSERRANELNAAAVPTITAAEKPLAVIVGHGPVGRVVDALLRDAGFHTVIIEMNLDTVEALTRSGHSAIYGDATRAEVLDQAGIRRAVHLIVTLPHAASRAPLVRLARDLNPDVQITVRARYLGEREVLASVGANNIIYEEGEAGIALARSVMQQRGLDTPMIERMLAALRKIWTIE